MGTVKIFLEGQNANYSSGQTLVGKVQCSFNSETTARAIRIRFKGRAKTRWTRKSGKNSTTYSAEEIYFNQEYNLAGGDRDITISPGVHTYPFSYILPQNLPSSFVGNHGDVKYKIKAKVDLPWQLDDEAELILYISTPVDLNYIAGTRNPFSQIKEDNVTCCCINNGTVAFSISLPRTGYAVGESMAIDSRVENMSNQTVETVSYELKRTDEFIGRSTFTTRQKYHEQVIAFTSARCIGAHGERSWTTSLSVPSDTFANLLPCSIINTTYCLKAVARLPTCYSNLKIKCPITLGTVPLIGIGSSNLVDLPPGFGDIASAPLEGNVRYLDDRNIDRQPTAPPSYDEATALEGKRSLQI